MRDDWTADCCTLVPCWLWPLQPCGRGLSSAALPDYFHPDEKIVLGHAVLIAGGRLNPHFFDWPGSLQFYVTAILIGFFFVVGCALGTFSSLSEFKRSFWTQPGPFYLLARWLDVACGVVTVYVVSRVVRPLGTIAVTIAACLVLFSPTHVRNSAFACGCPDRNADDARRRTLFAWHESLLPLRVLCLWPLDRPCHREQVLRCVHVRRRSHSGLDGPGTLPGQPGQTGGSRRNGRSPWLCAGCPFSLLDYRTFLSHLSKQVVHQQSGHIGFEPEGTRIVWFVARLLEPAVGLPALVLASIGCCLALVTSRYREYRPHLAVLLPCLLVIGNSNVSFDRYTVPLIPLVAVMSALPVSWVADRWKVPALLITVLAVAVPATRTAAMCYYECRVDTRYPAAAILAAQGIRGGAVLTTEHGPQVPGSRC